MSEWRVERATWDKAAEQARQEIADILNGKMPNVKSPIFDAIEIYKAIWAKADFLNKHQIEGKRGKEPR